MSITNCIFFQTAILYFQTANTFQVLSQERVEEAYSSFISTRAEDSDPNDEIAVRDEFNIIHAQLLHEMQNATSFKDYFTQPSLRKRCLVGWLVMFAGQGTATQVINS